MQVTEKMQRSDRQDYSSEEEQFEEKKVRRKRWGKPSPTTWRTLLNIGDTLMIVVSYISVMQFSARL